MKQTALWLLGFLVFGYLASVAAYCIARFSNAIHFFSVLDLFSHFTIQYALGGPGLALVFAAFKDWPKVMLCGVIFILCAIEMRWPMHHPLQFFPENKPAIYKIMTYNHNFTKTKFDDVEQWLSEQKDLDAVILLEANQKTVELGTALQDQFPYQIDEARPTPFGIVVLSRYPFLDLEKIPLQGPYYKAFAMKFSMKDPEASHPLTVYALHPYPPIGEVQHAQRDFELQEISKRARQDPSSNIVMLGDWNLTPFAPTFYDVLDISALHYQSYGFFLNPTWPSFNGFGFLKIPIDHILYSGSLIQVEKTVGPAFGSDHHALIAGYAENPYGSLRDIVIY